MIWDFHLSPLNCFLQYKLALDDDDNERANHDDTERANHDNNEKANHDNNERANHDNNEKANNERVDYDNIEKRALEVSKVAGQEVVENWRYQLI